MSGQWRVRIDRVVVRGIPGQPLDALELRAAVANGLAEALRQGSLPAGRAVRSSAVVQVGQVPGQAAALAATVAAAVSSAIRGGSRD
jgi:hypothetical protein